MSARRYPVFRLLTPDSCLLCPVFCLLTSVLCYGQTDRTLLDRYCVTCHNERAKTAGLTLDKLDTAHAGDRADVWEKVVRKIRAGMMPPSGAPRPDRAALDAFAADLETQLDRAAAASPHPGAPGLHRLNRTEYANAIRDLLSLEIDASRSE